MRASLRLPVDSSARIADRAVQRFLKWHLKTLESREDALAAFATATGHIHGIGNARLDWLVFMD
jgi:hypothetical protein